MKCAYFRFSTPQETYRRNYERLYSLSLEGVRNYFSDHVQRGIQVRVDFLSGSGDEQSALGTPAGVPVVVTHLLVVEERTL